MFKAQRRQDCGAGSATDTGATDRDNVVTLQAFQLTHPIG